ncbi:RNA polymerase sigma factor [Leptospira jelokensis]|uniref:RNA polymerase sigma factor n=1 Tax=Leptospira jelokensis TaxID=2484931 RepID=UPI0024680319|nr:sigma-70 family RNA polymerase sigma factor [Leptospira jelokensis]
MSQFEVLMKRYEGMVYSQARKAFLTKEEAEDFTQDVFLKAYESLSQFRGEAQFSTWLFQIAKFHITKVNKKKSHIQADWTEDVATVPDNSKPSTVEVLDKEETHHILHSLIAKLPKSYQLPIRLHYFENKPLKEIANDLNIKLGTIKSHISRGKELLRKWWSHEIEG